MKIFLYRIVPIFCLFFFIFTLNYSVNANYKEGQREVTRGSYKSAFSKFLEGASKGDPKAQNALGELYLHGRGTAKDFKKALIWFKFAANGGNKKAFKNLSYMYANGIGVKKNPLESSEWFKKYQDAESNSRKESLAIDAAKRNLNRRNINMEKKQKNRIQNFLNLLSKIAVKDARIFGQKMLKSSKGCEALIAKSTKGSWGSKNWAEKCLDNFWSIADISKDGKLSKAEFSRSYRLAVKWLLLEISDKGLLGKKGIPKSIIPSIDTILQLILPLATEIAFLNYDFNGDHFLDKSEITYDITAKEMILYVRELTKIATEFQSLTPSQMQTLMKEFKDIQQFFEFLQKLK